MSKRSGEKNKLVVTVAENAALGVLGNIVFLLLRLGINLVIIRSLGAGSYGTYVLAAMYRSANNWSFTLTLGSVIFQTALPKQPRAVAGAGQKVTPPWRKWSLMTACVDQG